MAVYRLADGANAGDVTKATNLLEASRPALINMGYTEFSDFTFTESYVQFQMNRARERWGFALNNAQTVLDALLQTIVVKNHDKVLAWGLFGWRQGLGLQAIRTARDEACKKAIEPVPLGWTVVVPDVSPSANIPNEYLQAKFGNPTVQTTVGIAGRWRYQASIESLRTAVGL